MSAPVQIRMAAVVAWGRIVYIGSRGTPVGTWMVGGPGHPDLETVDALARAALAARRRGGSIRLVDASDELLELLDLAGLRREVGGQAEGSEEVGVQEGVEPGDPVA
ncbi:MAG: hypothetical protein ABR511_00935 [Acidimicrobiales bacterium]